MGGEVIAFLKQKESPSSGTYQKKESEKGRERGFRVVERLGNLNQKITM